MKKVMFILLVVLWITGISFGVFIDDFEDGDWTNNPTWISQSSVDPIVMEDPVRSGNLVIRIFDTIYTQLEAPLSWVGFDFSGEFFAAETSSDHGFQLMTHGYHYFNIEVHEKGDLTWLRVSDGQRHLDYGATINSSFDDSWWRIHLWHDTETNLINANVHDSSGLVIGECSFESHEDLSALPGIGHVYLYIGGNGQYYDNITLIADPYDWYTYPANGHQYALTLQHSNWADAEAEAIAQGGHLVTINDEAESNWLLDTSLNPFGLQYAKDYQGNSLFNLVWIGLEHVDGDRMLPTSWAWQSGEPITFWNIDSYLYTYDNGNHMYMAGPFHPTIPGQWNCEIYQDTVPTRYLRGIIEYVPKLAIKTPNGGENLPHYSTYIITWETYSKVPVDDVLLEYSRDNGQAWESIGIVENTGYYEWEVPDANSDQCLVRISNSQYPVINDTSDNVFTIFECKKVLLGDLNNDCYINFYDIAIIALGWLDCGNPFDPACGL